MPKPLIDPYNLKGDTWVQTGHSHVMLHYEPQETHVNVWEYVFDEEGHTCKLIQRISLKASP